MQPMIRALGAAVAGTALATLFSCPAVEAACGDYVEQATEAPICKGGSGTFLPAFNRYGEENWPDGLKVVLYLAGLLWAFSGIGIVTDVFMEAIEVITSKGKEVKLDDGRTVHVRVSSCLISSPPPSRVRVCGCGWLVVKV